MINIRILNNLEVIVFKLIALALLATAGTSAIADDNSGLPLHGFASAGGGFSNHLTPVEQKINGFKIGTVDLYLSPEFDDRVKSLIEIAFEPSHANGAIGIDVERLQVGYSTTDYLTLWVGRMHTPYGVWNTTYHHGSQLQTSVYRPKFLDFEDGGGILPAHTVGLLGKGAIKLDDGKINYNLYVGNGSRILLDSTGTPGSLDMNNYRNDKDHYETGGSLSFMPQNGSLAGLEVGIHALMSQVASYTADTYNVLATHTTNLNMTGGFIKYANNDFELLSEYYGFSDSDIKTGSATNKSNAQYTQLAFMGNYNMTGFVRYEQTALNSRDNYFLDQTSGSSYTRYALGMKKDINAKAAFKLEFLRTTHDGSNPQYNIFQYDYCIRF